MADPLDVTSLLRDLARAIPRARRYDVELRRDPVAQTDVDPYEATRWVSSQSTLEAAQNLGDPAAPHLTAWIYALLLSRVSREEIVAAEIARSAPTVQVTTPRPAEISVREAIARLVRETAAPIRLELARVLVPSAGETSARELEVWSRHGEIARRLRLASPDAPFALLAEDADARALAAEMLAATDQHGEEALKGVTSWHEALAVGAAQAEEAPWPRALSPQVFSDLFRGEAGWLAVPGLELGDIPRLVVGSSFTRGFARFGARWADAARSRELPRALAHHPLGLERRTLGILVAGLLCEPRFLGRVLGFSRLEIERTRRAQVRVGILAARLAAARVLLRAPAFTGDRRALAEAAEEHVGRALGSTVPGELALVLPRLRLDDVARFLAFGEAARLATRLRDRFDEDWFRNPEAILSLRDRLGRAPPLLLTRIDAAQGIEALAARFGESLSAKG